MNDYYLCFTWISMGSSNKIKTNDNQLHAVSGPQQGNKQHRALPRHQSQEMEI